MPESNQKKIKIVVAQGDATSFEADVLVLKFARAHFGLDYAISDKLSRLGIDSRKFSPGIGTSKYFSSKGILGTKDILVIGVVQLYDFGYKDIRRFARSALQILSKRREVIEHICFTLHGAEYGLDELEAFEAEVAGLIDGITTAEIPIPLKKITIVEIDKRRAMNLASALEGLLPRGYVEVDLTNYLNDLGEEASEKFRGAGYSSANKPHVFVAMPFKEDMEDVYHYGILNAAKEAGFLCERADLTSFTGDVMEWVKKRLKSASLVIADLTTANSNVYLEVGYAWGVGVPTVLVVQKTDDLKFDIRGQRCIVYNRIKELEDKLKQELSLLKKELVI